MNGVDLSPMPRSYQALLADVFLADERVRAMWLHGAVARGAQDAGSDLDNLSTRYAYFPRTNFDEAAKVAREAADADYPNSDKAKSIVDTLRVLHFDRKADRLLNRVAPLPPG